MTQFANSRDTIVTEAIDGLVQTSNGRLARLDGYQQIKVVVRTDWDRSKVAVVLGGGSGHEPSHAGYVGKGMLIAAAAVTSSRPRRLMQFSLPSWLLTAYRQELHRRSLERRSGR